MWKPSTLVESPGVAPDFLPGFPPARPPYWRYPPFPTFHRPRFPSPAPPPRSPRPSTIIRCVHDTVSLNGLRDKLFELKCPDLASYFRQQYGPESSPAFKLAQRNFIESMAGYAVVCYLLQVEPKALIEDLGLTV
jgi:hypothetical protein